MFHVENKENDVKSQEERATKLLGEPVHQKVRRSVLKEFDPFAPESPLPQKIRQPVVEEEDIFEDAETSLPSYLGPVNKSTLELTPSRAPYGTRESLLIPELKEYRPGQLLLNLNETLDLSYSECVEDLSQFNSNQANVTSSDDFEFNYKPKARASIVTSINDSAEQRESLMDETLETIEKKSSLDEDDEHTCADKDCQHNVNSNKQTILKLEQFKEVGEATAIEKKIKLEEPSSDIISPLKETPDDKQQSQTIGGETEASFSKTETTDNDERMNQTFEPSLNDENTENDEVPYSNKILHSEEGERGQPTDVNEIIFVDTQLDRTCDATFEAGDPLNGLDPLNMENCGGIDDSAANNPSEQSAGENAQINGSDDLLAAEKSAIVLVSENGTIEDRLPANQSMVKFSACEEGQMDKTFEDYKAEDVVSPIIRARLEDQEQTNLGGEESECTNQTLEKPVAKLTAADAQATSESLPRFVDSLANEDKLSKIEDITSNVPESPALDVGNDGLNRTFDANNEGTSPEHEQPNNKSVVNEDKLSKVEDIALDLPNEDITLNLALETGGAELNNTFGTNNERIPSESDRPHDKSVANEDNPSLNLTLETGDAELNHTNNEGIQSESVQRRDKYVTNEDMAGKAEDITSNLPENPALNACDAELNKTFDANNEGGSSKSDQAQNSNETSTVVVECPEKDDQSKSGQLLEVNRTSTTEEKPVNIKKVDSSQPEISQDETIEAGAGENHSLKETIKDRPTQSNDNNDLLVKKGDLERKPDEEDDIESYAAEESFKKAAGESNMGEVEHSIGEDKRDLPQRADIASPEKPVQSSDELNSVPKSDLLSSESPCKSSTYQIRLEGDNNEELPEKVTPGLAQLNKTCGSNGEESVPESHSGNVVKEDVGNRPEGLPNTKPPCEPQISDQSVLIEAELVKVEPLNAHSDVELNVSEGVDADSSGKFSDVINETFETPHDDEASVSKCGQKDTEPNVPNGHQIAPEDDEENVDKRQSDETKLGVVKGESPEKNERRSTQLNKTFDSTIQEGVPESEAILQNTSQAKVEDDGLNQPLNAFHVTTNPGDVEPNISERADASSTEKSAECPDITNKTFETPDEDASVSKCEPNESEDVALASPVHANVPNCYQIKLEDGEDKRQQTNHQSGVNTLKKESPQKEEPTSIHLNKVCDASIQETVPESQPIGHQDSDHRNTSKSSCEIDTDAEFAETDVNQPKSNVVATTESPSELNETFQSKGVDQKYEQIISGETDKTFEATAEITPKLNHSITNSEGQINSQPLSDASGSNLINPVETTTSQPIQISENKDDIIEKHKAISGQLSEQNSSFVPETGESESERAVEALARSLNQTIDFEETAIVEDVDSTDTSSDNLNVTVEKVSDPKEDSCVKTEDVDAVVNQSPNTVEQKGNDEQDTEEKNTKDILKTEHAEKNTTQAESIDKKLVDKTTKPPNRRIECRPNIRSLRNKTQVITNPLLLKSEQTKQTLAQASDENEKLLNDYKRRNDQLRNDVNRLEDELDKLHDDNTKKDQCILAYALGREADRDNLTKYRRVIKSYGEHIIRQKEELVLMKAETEKLSRHFTSTEMAFSELFEKYEKAKLVVEAYRKNEAILIENITNAENQLAQLDAKCKAMQDKCNRDLERARQQIDQEEESYKHNIAKLQALVKRLEIKASSLETSLKQKTEECQALAALCDDITGNQSS